MSVFACRSESATPLLLSPLTTAGMVTPGPGPPCSLHCAILRSRNVHQDSLFHLRQESRSLFFSCLWKTVLAGKMDSLWAPSLLVGFFRLPHSCCFIPLPTLHPRHPGFLVSPGGGFAQTAWIDSSPRHLELDGSFRSVSSKLQTRLFCHDLVTLAFPMQKSKIKLTACLPPPPRPPAC